MVAFILNFHRNQGLFYNLILVSDSLHNGAIEKKIAADEIIFLLKVFG
jgi:hypothetical protein